MDLLDFCWAVWKYWYVVVTGGGITALLAVKALISHEPIGGLVSTWFFVAVFVAVFLAWRNERNEVIEFGEAHSGTLRVQAFEFWKEMRAYYSAHKHDPPEQLQSEFFEKFLTRLIELKDACAAAIGAQKMTWVEPASIGYYNEAWKIESLIHHFRSEASQVAPDIPA
jgi:hypothetical protein